LKRKDHFGDLGVDEQLRNEKKIRDTHRHRQQSDSISLLDTTLTAQKTKKVMGDTQIDRQTAR
jgi:hypothetical protein